MGERWSAERKERHGAIIRSSWAERTRRARERLIEERAARGKAVLAKQRLVVAALEKRLAELNAERAAAMTIPQDIGRLVRE